MTNPQCVWRTGCSAPEQCRLERRCTRSNPEDRERDLELRPSKEQIQPCSHGHTPGLCRLCMLAEIERLRKVYYKANDLIAYIGHQGEISSTAGEVDALQCALDDFDGGIPVSAPEPCHGLPTVERLDSMFAGDDLPPESRNVVSVEVTKEEWQAAKAELIARRHGLTAEQVSNARESLLNAVAERVRAAQPPPVEHARPLSEWSEAQGPVVWWAPPVREPSYIGQPGDSDWPGYHTHWTPHPKVPANIKEQTCVCGSYFLGPEAVQLRDSRGGMHYPKNPCTAPTKEVGHE